MNNFLIIIQSRYLSNRLPGKALLKIKKKEILYHLVQRVKLSKFKDNFIIATSKNKSDNIIANFCLRNNFKIFRGPLNNVYLRYVQIINKFKLDFVVRINGDSPLIDYKIIDKFILKYLELKKVDLVTNTLVRSYPKGQSVEVINSKSLLKLKDKIKKKEHLEHVTKYFYDYRKKFKIYNFKNKKKLQDINMSIDTKIDFNILKKVFLHKKFNYKLTFQQILRLNKKYYEIKK